MKAVLAGPRYSGKSGLFDLIQSVSGAKPHLERKERIITVTLDDHRLRKLQSLTKRPEIVFATYLLIDSTPAASDAESIALWRQSDVLVAVLKPNSLDEVQKLKTDFINELIKLDLEVSLPRYERLKTASAKGGLHQAVDKEEFEILSPSVEHLKKNSPLWELPLSFEAKKVLSHFAFLSLKNVVWVVNLSEENASASGFRKDIDSFAVAISLEQQLFQLSESERQEFAVAYGLEKPVAAELIPHLYRKGGYITFFTVGDREVRAWSLEKGLTAQKAAGKIHTDMEQGFIKAEVVRFEDYEKYGSKESAQYAGKLRLEGADYIVNDGDVLQFRFSK
ncbi:MAG: DUF933 domain-containing protein [Planctomycetota bacterium]|nr:DUF933 domain-containing protein [Planctomycetota bacterium]